MLVLKEVYGISFQATAIPIFDNQGNVIGGIGLGIGLENREILINNANLVAESANHLKQASNIVVG